MYFLDKNTNKYKVDNIKINKYTIILLSPVLTFSFPFSESPPGLSTYSSGDINPILPWILFLLYQPSIYSNNLNLAES